MVNDCKDYLRDIVTYTGAMGDVILKVIGDDKTTTIKAKRDDGSIILEVKFNKCVDEFKGTFGLSNLPMLSGLLNFPGFRDKDANVKIKRESKNNAEVCTEIVFDAPGAATASYRLTQATAIPTQYSYNSFDWAVVIDQPSKSKIAEFTQLASVYAALEARFTVKTSGKDLKFFIGQEESSSHKAALTFASDITGEIKAGWSWPINDVLNVLKLSNSAQTALRISNQGVLQIDIISSLAKYEFIFPGGN